MFNTLTNEIEITLKIVPKSPLLIKSAKDNNGNLIEWNKTLKTEEPFIPGSTLKGRFRELFYSIWYDHFNLEEDKFLDIPQGKYSNDDKVYDYEDYMEEILKDQGEDIFLERSLKISKLFGAKGLKSRFFISDAYFEKSFNESFIVEKPITPIDRFTGGAVVPLLFQYTKEPFLCTLNVKNIEKDELKNILFAIRDSKDGDIRIGSSKTRGFGEVELEIKEVKFREYKKSDFNLDGFIINDKNSLKLGDKYLYTTYSLKYDDLKKIVG